MMMLVVVKNDEILGRLLTLSPPCCNPVTSQYAVLHMFKGL